MLNPQVLIVTKPESIAAGVHKPSLLPIAQLKRHTTASSYIIGPHIMGCVDGLVTEKRKYTQSKSIMMHGVKAKRITGTDSSDFVTISKDADENMDGDHPQENEDQQVQELKTTVTELREEIGRWKTVAQKLKAAAAK